MGCTSGSSYYLLLHSGNPSVWSTWVPMTELFAAGFILGISYTFTKIYGFQLSSILDGTFPRTFGFEISGINVDSWKMISRENTGNVPDIVSGGAFAIEDL